LSPGRGQTCPQAEAVDSVDSAFVNVGAHPRAVRLGLVCVAVVGLLFFASWWNRSVAPTTGGEAVVMALGYLPYRDYFTHAPPGMAILGRIIGAISNKPVLASMAFGSLLRIGAACALYGLVLRMARPWCAALATLCAVFVSSAGTAETPFYYNHVSAAFVLIGTYLGLVGAEGTGVRHRLAAAGAGALLTFAIAIKQTMLFGVAGALMGLLVLALPRPRGGWSGWLLGLLAGAGLTIGGLWAWLAAHDLVGAFLLTMRTAPQGKGGVARSLLRPFTLLFEITRAPYATLAAWVVIALVATAHVSHRRQARFPRALGVLIVLVGVLIGALFVDERFFVDARFVSLWATALGWWGSLAIAAFSCWRSLRMGAGAAERARVALGVLAFGIGFSFAVSWPLFECMALPGLAVVVAALLDQPPSSTRRLWVPALSVLVCASMGVAVWCKFSDPHAWGYWREPPLLSARGTFEHRSLAGMQSSKAASTLYSAVAMIAQERTDPSDRIFVYPNMPVLYAIAERRPATYSLVHWVDTCPDFLGKEDASRLSASPPKLLIQRLDTLSLVEGEERLFRGGERSSVRDIYQAIKDISPLYDVIGIFEVTAGTPIVFLLRRD
jgi:hypothetical protein